MSEIRHTRLAPRALFLRRLAQNAGIALVGLGGSLLFGMWGYWYFEGMHWIDAFLNSAMLLGGMGQIGDLSSTPAKLFAALFALYAGLVLIAVTTLILAPVLHRVLHSVHLEESDLPGNAEP